MLMFWNAGCCDRGFRRSCRGLTKDTVTAEPQARSGPDSGAERRVATFGITRGGGVVDGRIPCQSKQRL